METILPLNKDIPLHHGLVYSVKSYQQMEMAKQAEAVRAKLWTHMLSAKQDEGTEILSLVIGLVC